jgi:hypothetical protein
MFVSTRSTLPWIRRILAMREGRYNTLNMFVIPTFNEQRIAERTFPLLNDIAEQIHERWMARKPESKSVGT